MKRRDFLSKAGVAGATTAAAATTLATPAIAQDRIEIAMVATWGRDFPGLGTGAQRFASRLGDVSDGRIQVTYYAAGERVGAFDSFDEVASGNAQAYHAADYYWKGKHPGWAYFTAVPFGHSYSEMESWINWMGGQELWDELAGEFGLKCMEGRSFTSRALKASQLETLNTNSAQVTNTAIGCLRDRVQEGHPVGGKEHDMASRNSRWF